MIAYVAGAVGGYSADVSGVSRAWGVCCLCDLCRSVPLPAVVFPRLAGDPERGYTWQA